MKIPNNKILSLLVAIVLVVTIVISYNEYRNNIGGQPVAKKSAAEVKPTIVLQNTYESKDSDSDGLSDWEEVLWKTDPKKKDSDGDGTNDGEEVALSRDPLKKGPSDKYSETNSLVDSYTPFFQTDYNTLTSKVARTILTKSTEGAGAAATAEITAQIKAELEIAKIYKKENLITFEQSDKKKMEKYSEELMRIQVEEIITSTKTNSDPYSYSKAYKNMALKLSAIEVPLNLAGLHVDLVNNYNALSIMALRVADTEKDPIVLLATIPEYTTLISAQKLIIEQIKLYYENNDIIFVKSYE